VFEKKKEMREILHGVRIGAFMEKKKKKIARRIGA